MGAMWRDSPLPSEIVIQKRGAYRLYLFRTPSSSSPSAMRMVDDDDSTRWCPVVAVDDVTIECGTNASHVLPTSETSATAMEANTKRIVCDDFNSKPCRWDYRQCLSRDGSNLDSVGTWDGRQTSGEMDDKRWWQKDLRLGSTGKMFENLRRNQYGILRKFLRIWGEQLISAACMLLPIYSSRSSLVWSHQVSSPCCYLLVDNRRQVKMRRNIMRKGKLWWDVNFFW